MFIIVSLTELYVTVSYYDYSKCCPGIWIVETFEVSFYEKCDVKSFGNQTVTFETSQPVGGWIYFKPWGGWRD